MKKKQIISALLVSALALSVVGCGSVTNKGEENASQQTTVDVAKEEAFTTIPEEKLVTDYMKNKFSGADTLVQEGTDFINLYYFDKTNSGTTDLISKYNLDYVLNTVYAGAEVYSKNPELFEVGITRLYAQFHMNKAGVDSFVNGELRPQTENYLSDVWMNEEKDEYHLASELKEKNPKDAFQKYLKENKIEITNITYDKVASDFNFIAGAEVVTVEIDIAGIQNKKEFQKNILLDFYFSPSDEIRTAVKNDDNLSKKDFEIMAVSKSVVSKADSGDFKYDVNKAKERFEIR